jgi:nucleoid DNA-binding protein|tara:strand:- start:1251 stop:1478 length:228 start_codon:yes stop_codon:yes gene_type:complete
MSQNKNFIIYKIANKYNLPLQTVERIINFQFKYLATIMKEGKFDSVRLPYFGKFSVKKGRLAHIKRLTNKKNEQD